jgi:hypothetical protein
MSDRIEEVVVTTAPASRPLPWEFRETVDVARPAEEVFAFVTQPENVPRDQLLQIRGAVAEYERTLIAERMRRGRQARLRVGTLLPWTRVPFGYRLDPERPGEVAGVRVAPGRGRAGRPAVRLVPATAGDLVPVRRADGPHVPEEGGGGV